jgi:hypothetical protein
MVTPSCCSGTPSGTAEDEDEDDDDDDDDEEAEPVAGITGTSRLEFFEANTNCCCGPLS